MSLDAKALRKLASLDLTSEQMAGVLDVLASMTEQEEARKASQRERTRKFREKIGVTLQSQHGNGDRSRAGDARVEDKTSNLGIEPQEKKDTPRAALEAVLDGTHAAAVIEHRQRIRKPLTAYAAAKLAGKFAQCADPNAAADKMIGNGWQGFEPEWMSKPDARGSPSQRPMTAQEILKARRQVNSDDDRPPNRPVLIASR